MIEPVSAEESCEKAAMGHKNSKGKNLENILKSDGVRGVGGALPSKTFQNPTIPLNGRFTLQVVEINRTANQFHFEGVLAVFKKVLVLTLRNGQNL